VPVGSWPESGRPLTSAEASAPAWIAAGSNLGDREAYLSSARRALAATPGILALVAGLLEETAPLGGLDQPPYLNQMFVVDTSIDPRMLLHVCHDIERGAGRQRASRWDSRTLDLDLVRYGDLLCDLPELSLPHPGLRDRSFWAREIAALEIHG
jgi:2-amino-4-hydroxy-6-hydroxymethyldihydropteridine diphosphokinase